jgi:hypothetical protein
MPTRRRAKAPESEKQGKDTDSRPLTEQIAALAHALWTERGCPDGSSEEDWFKAELQIKERRSGEIVTLLQHVRTGAGD